jgi:hypothetical protein
MAKRTGEDDGLILYGSIPAWSKKLGIPVSTLRKRLKMCPSIMARTWDDSRPMTAYAETDVRRVCRDLLQSNP